MAKFIFEDKWCRLTPDVLTIKCYYFPLGTNKQTQNAPPTESATVSLSVNIPQAAPVNRALTVSEVLWGSKLAVVPTHRCTSEDININSIKGVFFEQQNAPDQCLKVKGWGMSCSPCWWACDLRRNWHSSSGPVHFNVVIDCGETLYKGFTVIDITNFIVLLKTVTRSDTTYGNHFPF